MQELNINEVNQVSGGIVQASSWFGHLGRAFAFGYGLGTMLQQINTTVYDEDRGAGAWG